MELNTKIFLSFVLSFGALGAAYMVFYKYRGYKKHQLEFLDLVYDSTARQLELFVVNQGEKSVYVNPSLRLIHFLNPEEWREKNSNGNGNGNSSPGYMAAGKCYQVDSVIKGYSLIGDCPESVRVEGKSVRKIVYPLPDDISLRVYDNIQVDSMYGVNSDSESRLVNTMRVMLKDDVDCGVFDGVVPEGVDGIKPAYNPNFCTVPTVDKEGVIAESDFPLQAMCVCCGKDRWLGWIVDGNHVCSECKDFLDGGVEQLVDEGFPLLAEQEAEIFVGDILSQREEVCDSGADVGLKPRHKEILGLLEHENNLTVKKISKLLSLQESTVVSDLNFLMKSELVGRVKVGNKFMYHLA
ncbi:MAG: DeoR family transcriptional regulator [Candidatus Altiarchaeales archaeon]|nr:DeoR family transcriptional regulator [Candidatus Altiarchaeales archaeon]